MLIVRDFMHNENSACMSHNLMQHSILVAVLNATLTFLVDDTTTNITCSSTKLKAFRVYVFAFNCGRRFSQ